LDQFAEIIALLTRLFQGVTHRFGMTLLIIYFAIVSIFIVVF